MGYSLKQNELLATGIKRVACEQIDQALAEIDSSSLTTHQIVHQVRKRCKKIRGVLRLVTPELGDIYTYENEWYRDSAKGLANVRDARVLVESCEKLLNHYASAINIGSFADFEYHLALFRDETTASQSDVDQDLLEFRQRMLEARDRVEGWPLKDKGFAMIADGLANTYQHGKRTLEVAYKETASENFHEWRKQVKYHWYHTRLLKNLWPPILESRINELKVLSDCLGDEHDLTVLEQQILKTPNTFGSEKMIEAFIGLLRQRQEHLRQEMRPLGERLFAEKTECHVQRMECYWQIWQQSNL